jgi:hypothetical protein
VQAKKVPAIAETRVSIPLAERYGEGRTLVNAISRTMKAKAEAWAHTWTALSAPERPFSFHQMRLHIVKSFCTPTIAKTAIRSVFAIASLETWKFERDAL